jgi:hypothetical protein
VSDRLFGERAVGEDVPEARFERSEVERHASDPT